MTVQKGLGALACILEIRNQKTVKKLMSKWHPEIKKVLEYYHLTYHIDDAGNVKLHIDENDRKHGAFLKEMKILN